jgi:hypothetical protein
MALLRRCLGFPLTREDLDGEGSRARGLSGGLRRNSRFPSSIAGIEHLGDRNLVQIAHGSAERERGRDFEEEEETVKKKIDLCVHTYGGEYIRSKYIR